MKMNRWMFKTDCGQKLTNRNLIFQHILYILTKIFWKKTFKISLRYLENELRHLCPLNPISCRCQTPSACWTNHIYKTELCPHHQAFSCLAPSMRVPNMRVQQAEGGWQWQTHLETGFCPHHPTLAWLAPSMWFGIVWKQARFGGHISASGWHRCGIFWLGWFMDVGRYEGVAPSMWAFPAWFWRMSGSCAIYVPKRQLDIERKLLGEISAEDCKK